MTLICSRAELQSQFDIETALTFGTLPDVYLNPSERIGILEAYVTTYLREEIQQEALVKEARQNLPVARKVRFG